MNPNKAKTQRVRNMRRARGVERGAAAIEFALVVPLLLVVLFGIVEFSLVLYDKAIITNASREAARAGVVWANTTTQKPSQQTIQNVAAAYCSNYLISLGGGASTCASATIQVSGAQGASGTQLSVTVPYSFTVLSLGGLVRPFSGPLTMSATTVMNNE